MDKIFCVISHTHWDREWYMPFEKFRIKLVNLIDNVLDILRMNPEYIFHLDAQTVVLEDYLEIKPGKKDLLKKYIKEGRLIVGPWYVQNDFYLTSGEATIRNLLIGSSIAEEFGRCSRIGYAADQFGMMSQLPQIFNGFGIDSCIFGRGYNFYNTDKGELTPEIMPSEFIWRGNEGSEVLTVHMVYWYNNAQRFSEDLTKSMKLLKRIEDNFNGIALTPYLLLMNGVDHLEAQENLLPLLEKLNRGLLGKSSVKQYTMEKYIEDVKEYINENRDKIQLNIYQGEMRNGTDNQLLQGTLSSRIYLKVLNFNAQNLLEGLLEPLYSFIHLMGAESRYPSDYINYLWKCLVKNHAHDSICGCSRDEVHEHMADRYKVINEIGGDLLQRGINFFSSHISRDGLNTNDYLITVLNTVEGVRNEVVDIELQFPEDEYVENFEVLDPEGNLVPFTILFKEKMNKGIFTDINLPGNIPVDSFRIQFYVGGLAGFGYRTYIVKPQKHLLKDSCEPEEKVSTKNIMENEFLKVLINPDGKIDLLVKETGRIYKDMLMLEDTEDCGDSYVYKKAVNSKTITSREFIPELSLLRDNPFEKAYGLKYIMKIPEFYDEVENMRSSNLVDNIVKITLRLKKGSKRLEIEFECDNASRDHRLRAFVSTGINSDFTQASTPFDIILRDKKDILKGICNGTQPNSGFINIEEEGDCGGISLFTEGIYEYENIIDKAGVLALTLIRSTGWISRDPGTGCHNNYKDDTWMAPGNQCIGKTELRLAIQPHSNSMLNNGVFKDVRLYQNPVITYFQPADLKKFTGGRPAVQDSEIKEIFYREDPFAHIKLPLEKKFFDVSGKNIVVSALKKAENDDSLLLRLYNAGDEYSEASVSFTKMKISAYRMDLKEEIIEEMQCDENQIKPFGIKPKSIVTIGIKRF